MDSKEYWDDRYKKGYLTTKPSSFAKFFYGYEPEGVVVDFGCGNGRDTLFFASKGLITLGVDQSEVAIKKLRTKHYKTSYVDFMCADVDSIKGVFPDKIGTVYARFVLHALTEQQEDDLLDWASDNLKKGGLLAIETRSVDDPHFGVGEKISDNEWLQDGDHYRRFTTFKKLTDKVKSKGFELVYNQCAKGLAKYKKEDPRVIRIIAKKK